MRGDREEGGLIHLKIAILVICFDILVKFQG